MSAATPPPARRRSPTLRDAAAIARRDVRYPLSHGEYCFFTDPEQLQTMMLPEKNAGTEVMLIRRRGEDIVFCRRVKRYARHRFFAQHTADAQRLSFTAVI